MSEEMIQHDVLKALEGILSVCITSKACIKCPLRRYEHARILRDKIYEASELCSVYDVFGQIPMNMDLKKITRLFEEGRIGTDEILHKEDGQGSDAGRRAEDQTDQAADHGERDAEDPRTDH